MTGRVNPQAPQIIPARTNELAELIRLFFPRQEPTVYTPQEVPLEDEAIWGRLFHSKNGTTFQSLFNGDVSVAHNDHSRGVIFLANRLALLTDGDAARMRSRMYQTGLVTDKWESKRGGQTWIDYQIKEAIRWANSKKR